MPDIENREALTRVFGYWPSFHDAEILSIHLDREGQSGYSGPTLEAKVHLFKMTSEVDERGSYVLRHHTLAKLRFLQVDNFKAEGFNQQNILWGLDITDVSERGLDDIKFAVRFPSSFGLEMEFCCKAVAVVRADPYRPSV
jgi:Immunity protein 50